MQRVIEVSQLIDEKLAGEQTKQMNALYSIYLGRGGVDPNQGDSE